MNRRAMDMWVGLFVVIGFAAIVFLAMRVGNLTQVGARPGYILQAHFDNIGALKPQAPIRVAGVTVGKVESIQLNSKTYQADVKLKIEAAYHFPKDTIASVLTSGLLGEQYIGLDAGGDSEMLKESDTLMKANSAVVLEKLISQFLFSKASEGSPSTPGATK
ncbi:MAG: outer membrane lipid asymmetry maintenance protein MlaD [Pseudomonadota bacterium]